MRLSPLHAVIMPESGWERLTDPAFWGTRVGWRARGTLRRRARDLRSASDSRNG